MCQKATQLTQPSQSRTFQCASAEELKSPSAAAYPSLQMEKYFLCEKYFPISYLHLDSKREAPVLQLLQG